MFHFTLAPGTESKEILFSSLQNISKNCFINTMLPGNLSFCILFSGSEPCINPFWLNLPPKVLPNFRRVFKSSLRFYIFRFPFLIDSWKETYF